MVTKRNKHFKSLFSKTTTIVVLFGLLLFPEGFINAQTTQELKTQINNLSNAKEILTDEVATFNAQINALQQQLAQTESKITGIQIELNDTVAKIKIAEDELVRQKGMLDENLRILYEESQTSSIEVVAGSDNFSEFINKTEYLKSIQDKVSESIDKIKQLKIELDTKKKELDTKKTEQLTLKNQQAAEKAGLDQQLAAKDASLSQVTADEKALSAELAKRMSAGYAYCKGGGAVIHAKNPIFTFPLNCGYISQGFGMTQYASCDQEGNCGYKGAIHNGIDIAQVGAGTAILAIGPGTVYSTGTSPSGGWGNWIVIKHDNGYYSLYAHMISPSYLSSGDKVDGGQAVGGVGGTPHWPIHLHLSLYKSDPGSGPSYPGDTIDPLDYMDIPISTGGTDWADGYAH